MPLQSAPLINLAAASEFTQNGTSGKVYPKFLNAGEKFLHSKHFYVEFPADGKGKHKLIDASRLVSIIGDGGVQRHFKPSDVAKILSGIHVRFNMENLIKSIAV